MASTAASHHDFFRMPFAAVFARVLLPFHGSNTSCERSGTVYLLLGVAGGPGDAAEDAVFENSWEYRSICLFKSAKNIERAVDLHLDRGQMKFLARIMHVQ